MGAAMTGLRPVAELMFSDFFAVTWDMVANQIADPSLTARSRCRSCCARRTAVGSVGAPPRRSRTGRWPFWPEGRARQPGRQRACRSRDPRSDRDRVRGEEILRRRARCRTATRRAVGPSAGGRDGSDATLVALVSMVPRALEAAERLAAGPTGFESSTFAPRATRRLDDPRERRETGRLSPSRTRGCAQRRDCVVADEGFWSPTRPSSDHDSARASRRPPARDARAAG
jgi:pyruvate dehydrogenase E1 component beta subunit